MKSALLIHYHQVNDSEYIVPGRFEEAPLTLRYALWSPEAESGTISTSVAITPSVRLFAHGLAKPIYRSHSPIRIL